MPHPFEPHPLLRGPHRQTLFGAFGLSAPEVAFRPERFELPDGDFVDLEHAGPERGPRAILLHGLGGNVRSGYLRMLAATLVARGWAVTAFQFRGASETPNRTPRLYHSGDTADIALVAAALRTRTPWLPLVAIGFSLGGNVLLKLLGETGPDAPLDAGVAVSVPFMLDVAADRLARGASQVYGRFLLAQLKRRLRAARARMQAHVDLGAALAARDFRTWDALVTAPLGGFASADDYYARASSRAFVGRIARPTLVLHALDDPFMTAACVPTTAEIAPAVELEAHAHGGHVGFIERGPRGLPRGFVDRRVAEWLESHK